MIKVIQTNIIKEDGVGSISRINGRLDKISIKLGKASKTVRLIIKTDENELVHDDFFRHDDSVIDVIYPYILVENLLEGNTHTKDFFMNNFLTYEIHGLGDENYIEYIRFYYETDIGTSL